MMLVVGSAPVRRGSVLAVVLGMAVSVSLSPPVSNAAVRVTAATAVPVTTESACSAVSPVTPALQAGARSDFCLALSLDGGRSEIDIPGLGDDARNIKISLPAGQIGDPSATELCAPERFRSASGCPVASQVGEVTARADAGVTLGEQLLQGPVHLLSPSGTEAAQLGVQIGLKVGSTSTALVKVTAQIRLRPGDGGLDATLEGIPRSLLGIPIELRRVNLRLWGSPAQHPTLRAPFMTSPTACAAATTRVTVTSYAGVSTSGQTAFTPTGCDVVPFAPELILEGDRAVDAPVELTAGVRMPPDTGAVAQSHVGEATVILPEGVELSATSGNEIADVGCTDDEFDVAGGGPVACPAGAALGTATMSSPLLATLGGSLPGTIYLAQPRPTDPLIRLFIVAQAGPEVDAVRVKLSGVVTPDPATGQLTTVLRGIPPVPFSEFRLTFRGGEAAIVSSPRACGATVGTGILVPVSGGAPVKPQAELAFTEGCSDAPVFEPGLAVAATPAQAGASTALQVRFSRPDRHARLAGLEVRLPPGLIGRLTAARLCELDVASRGACGPESLVGSVTASAGPGPRPLELKGGEVFLTKGDGDALAGLAIKMPVRIGPLDFGSLLVRGRIIVRPDIGLTLRVDEIPLRLSVGVATGIRDLTVTLDRPGFIVNATSCAAKTVAATLRSDIGAFAEASAGYEPTGCDALGYAPRLGMQLGGGSAETGSGGHPSLQVDLTQDPGQANTSRVELTLPPSVSADIDRLKNACPQAAYVRDACPAGSVVGAATAATPLLDETLRGPVTFVSVPGSPLPMLRIRLGGPLTLDLDAKITLTKDNRLTTTIEGVPDVPLSNFRLTLDAGPRSPLTANRDLCTAPAQVGGSLGSHTGSSLALKQDAVVVGCGPAATLKLGSLKTGRPTADLRVVGGRTRMTSVTLSMPRGLELERSSKVRRRLKVSATGLRRRARATVTVSGSRLRVTVPRGQSAKVLRVRVATGALRASRRLRRAGRPRLTFNLTTVQADRSTSRSRLRIRPAPASSAAGGR